MKYKVHMTSAAEEDLTDLVRFIALHDSPSKALRLNDRLQEVIDNLESQPQRGRHIPELEQFHATDLREIIIKPYRIMYYIEGTDVFIYGIFDGRRNIAPLLLRRLTKLS